MRKPTEEREQVERDVADLRKWLYPEEIYMMTIILGAERYIAKGGSYQKMKEEYLGYARERKEEGREIK